MGTAAGADELVEIPKDASDCSGPRRTLFFCWQGSERVVVSPSIEGKEGQGLASTWIRCASLSIIACIEVGGSGPSGPLGFQGAQHRQTFRPSVDGIRSKALPRI